MNKNMELLGLAAVMWVAFQFIKWMAEDDK